MIGIGIDIGSTAAKAAVVDGEGSVAWTCVQPTGFSSVDASERLREALAAAGYDVTAEDARVVATGYGRVAVPYAHKVVTEITCHGTGAVRLFGDHGTLLLCGKAAVPLPRSSYRVSIKAAMRVSIWPMSPLL